jgi:hypothetical protein
MNEDGRANSRAVMQERDDFRVVQIARADMIADLNAEMSARHGAIDFGARGIDILQRRLAKRAQTAAAAPADLECGVVEDAGAFERMGCVARVSE